VTTIPQALAQGLRNAISTEIVVTRPIDEPVVSHHCLKPMTIDLPFRERRSHLVMLRCLRSDLPPARGPDRRRPAWLQNASTRTASAGSARGRSTRDRYSRSAPRQLVRPAGADRPARPEWRAGSSALPSAPESRGMPATAAKVDGQYTAARGDTGAILSANTRLPSRGRRRCVRG